MAMTVELVFASAVVAKANDIDVVSSVGNEVEAVASKCPVSVMVRFVGVFSDVISIVFVSVELMGDVTFAVFISMVIVELVLTVCVVESMD